MAQTFYTKLSCFIKLICAVTILFRVSIALSNFGESCLPIPYFSSANPGSLNPVYMHLFSNIDMITNVTDPCNPNNNKLRFCIKNPAGSAKICNLIELNEGATTTLDILSSNNPNLGGNKILKNIQLKVRRKSSDVICLSMETSNGIMDLGCKSTALSTPATLSTIPIPSCTYIGESCYNGQRKSQSIFNFSGKAVHCLKETLDQVFFQQRNCVPNPEENVEPTMLASFAKFQAALKSAIRAAFILYFMFYGFKVVLNHEYGELNHIATFLLKFLFVAYFSVGLGPISFDNNTSTNNNGMVEMALPFLSQAAASAAQMVFNAAGNKGLCEFDIKKYQRGYEFYGVWDTIDCRIGYYLGLRLLYDIGDLFQNMNGKSSNPENNKAADFGSSSPKGIASLWINGTFAFFIVIFGFFMAGNLIIVVSGLAFVLIFVSIVLHFITSYFACLVTLYLMAYISPIFIPMALFDRTKGYFDSWLKITLSCALQPAILAGFIALLLTMYDDAIYKNCQYLRHDYSIDGSNLSTFELREPSTDPEDCRNSLGYKLQKLYTGQGWEDRLLMFFPISYIDDILEVLVDFLYIFVFTVICYHMSKSLSRLASEITSGPNMSAIVASPTLVVKAAVDSAKFAQDAANSLKNAAKPKTGSDDKPEGGGGEGSGGDAGGLDKISGGSAGGSKGGSIPSSK